jgi:hypothetical protein
LIPVGDVPFYGASRLEIARFRARQPFLFQLITHSTRLSVISMIGHTEQASAMRHSWLHLTGFVCPKVVATATVSLAKRAKGNRAGSDYAITRGRGEN